MTEAQIVNDSGIVKAAHCHNKPRHFFYLHTVNYVNISFGKIFIKFIKFYIYKTAINIVILLCQLNARKIFKLKVDQFIEGGTICHVIKQV